MIYLHIRNSIMIFKSDCSITKLLLVVQVVIFTCASGDSIQPEFIEPLKNMTIGEGSNVEFACAISNLGSYRVMWLKKDGNKETFVAVNMLKITKNPRISVSVLQISSELTQSTVYVRNIQMEDQGVYECAINTNPMISRTGTLIIPKSQDKILSSPLPLKTDQTYQTKNADILEVYINGSSLSDNNLTTSETEGLSVNGTLDEIAVSNKNSSDVETGCAEMKSYWEDATDNIKEMLKNALTSLVNFTCSFLTPNQ